MAETVTPDLNSKLRQADAGYWALSHGLRLANGVKFSFNNRPYLRKPMSSTAIYSGSIKATGGGFSECQGILPSIHGMITRKYPQGVGYFFPTDTDMQDYVQSRFNPLIQDNFEAIGKFVPKGKGSTDKTSLKRIGGSNLYLRGSTLSPGDEGGDTKKSTKLQGIQFDRAVIDEVDQLDPEAISKIEGRLGNAAIFGIIGKREIRYIANPSDSNRGIDLMWQRSDQQWWHQKCLGCGTLTNPVKEFLNDPERSVGVYKESPDGHTLGYMKCCKCGMPLGFNDGEYVADNPEVKDLEMFQWSHLSSAYHDPYMILKRFRDPPNGNLGDVYRLDLGMAYSSSEDQLRKDVVLSCCGQDGMPERHTGPCAMGVDNDDKKHVVIGIRTGNDRYRIIKVAQVESFAEVHDLAQRFNVKSEVADLRPNADSARAHQKNEKHKVFLCEYTPSNLNDYVFNENTGIVKAYRTGVFDATHRLFTNGNIVLPRQTKEIENFAQQCCNCVKGKDTSTKGVVNYIYKKTGNGNDHYRNALNYFIMAASGSRVKTVNPNRTSNKELQYVNNDTDRYI